MRSLAFLVVALVALPVRAQAPDAEARRLYTAGQQAYDAGRYDVAIKAFEAAYQRAPSDLLVFDDAQAYRKKYIEGGDAAVLDKAIALYRRFLASPATGRERSVAGDAVAELLLLAAHRREAAAPPSPPSPVESAPPAKTEIMIVTESAGARVALDDRAPSPAPLLETVAPGEHHAHVTAPGYAATDLRVTAVAGRFVVSEARLQPLPSAIEVNGARRGVLLRLDGQDEMPVPSGPIAVPAGAHHVQLRLPGFVAWQQNVQVERGERVSLRPRLVPTARRRAVRWLGVTAGLVGLATIAPAVVWARSDHDAGALYDQLMNNQGTLAEVSQYYQARDTRTQGMVATTVMLSVGGLLAATTAVLYLVDRR